MATDCDFSSVIDDKKLLPQDGVGLRLKFENECLKKELGFIKGELKEVTDSHESQSEKVSSIESILLEFKESHQNTHEIQLQNHSDIIEQQQRIFDETTKMYENFALWLTVVIGLAGVISIIVSLYFITKYRKREIQEMVDNAVNNVKEKVENSDFLKSAIVNSFDQPEVKCHIENIKIDLMNEQEHYIRTIINDTYTEEQSNLGSILEQGENDATR